MSTIPWQLTIAHAMGTTIGINTTILLASVFYIISNKYKDKLTNFTKIINTGFYAYHASLLIFLIVIVMSGIERSKWMQSVEYSSFREIQSVSLIAITFPAIKITLNTKSINAVQVLKTERIGY